MWLSRETLATQQTSMMQSLLLILGVGWITGMILLIYFPRLLLRPLPSSPWKIGKETLRILLLVAHPDDECMFFGPTLLSLTIQDDFELRVLSVSSGNAEGLGNLRKLEMLSSCSVLRVPVENVTVLDHPSLQDGHNQSWDQQLLAKVIEETVESQEIDLVITFDRYGVSGHPNHSALSQALRAYLLRRKLTSLQKDGEVQSVEGWELVSLNILRKFSGVLEISFSAFTWLLSSNKRDLHCFVTPNPYTSIAAMRQHKSQWLWFRRLFIVFASYTYVNTLRRIDLKGSLAPKIK